jgi:hypothetical protein
MLRSEVNLQSCSGSKAAANLSVDAMRRILGIKSPVALTPAEMAKSLRVAFYPTRRTTQKLEGFLARLREGLIACGAKVISYEEALAEGANGRIGKGIVLVAPGEGETGNLAIDHVASLSSNTVVGVLDGTLPGLGEGRLQKRLNALVGALVWHMAHVIIYIDDLSWTLCNMNGAIDTFSLDGLEQRIPDSLVPKLAAPVVPPQRADFDVREGAFDPSAEGCHPHISDLLAGAELFGKAGLLLSQTSIADLAFRNNKYKKIAAAYLSWRTGMSYGFLARQLQTVIEPALERDDAPRALKNKPWEETDFHEIDGSLYVAVNFNGRRWLVRVPEVAVLCTRSGCNKTDLDPRRDIVKLALKDGRFIFATPREVAENGDCQPSFDTATILAHAVGNVVVASVLGRLRPQSSYYSVMNTDGLALAHWHGFLHPADLPPGYYFYGQANPPVSCSTPQAAIYALAGKLAALEKNLTEGIEYIGDVHEEPSHGTNMIGASLVGLAHLIAAPAT